VPAENVSRPEAAELRAERDSAKVSRRPPGRLTGGLRQSRAVLRIRPPLIAAGVPLNRRRALPKAVRPESRRIALVPPQLVGEAQRVGWVLTRCYSAAEGREPVRRLATRSPRPRTAMGLSGYSGSAATANSFQSRPLRVTAAPKSSRRCLFIVRAAPLASRRAHRVRRPRLGGLVPIFKRAAGNDA
jgi:hypothetical protein